MPSGSDTFEPPELENPVFCYTCEHPEQFHRALLKILQALCSTRLSDVRLHSCHYAQVRLCAFTTDFSMCACVLARALLVLWVYASCFCMCLVFLPALACAMSSVTLAVVLASRVAAVTVQLHTPIDDICA